ncbi:MAG: prenyltransferase/squalene oxidase repeat-containing protein [Verrucomicrobiota bacterium]
MKRLIFTIFLAGSCWFANAQVAGPNIRYGDKLPPDVEVIYQRGLTWLVANQTDDGSWSGSDDPGITGLCIMAFLASGEDPNFGRYAGPVRRALRSIILSQNKTTGYLGNSMYHHGFGMLGLAEAYGAVDDTLLWDGTEDAEDRRTIGEALDLAVRSAITSQNNNRWGGWRYSPESTDADTSVTGAVLVGLLAARNAGLEVPDENIDKALGYFKQSTGPNGMVAYSGGIGGMGESMNRSAIATLVYSVGKKKDWDEFDATLKHLTDRIEHNESSYPHYFRYYMAQALFQGDFESWQKWNAETIRFLKQTQQQDGSFPGSHGVAYGTAMSLLSLALNYRFLPIYER